MFLFDQDHDQGGAGDAERDQDLKNHFTLSGFSLRILVSFAKDNAG